jgi:O-Antigen ligase
MQPIVAVLPVAALAAAIGFLTALKIRVGIALASATAAVVLLLYPWWALVFAIWLIPVQTDVLGSSVGGLNIGMSDLLIALTVAGLVPLFLLQESWRKRLAYAWPALLWTLPFLLWLAIVVIDHPSATSAANAIQYGELSALGIALGATVLDRRLARIAILGFITVAAILALLWAAHIGRTHLGDKNPSGQFMVDAALLSLVVVRRARYRYPVILLLIVGILFTESRGAVLGAAIGVLVLAAFRGLGTWRRTAAVLLPVAVVLIIGYNLVPASLHERAQSTFSSVGISEQVQKSEHIPDNNRLNGDLTPALYTIQLRTIYRREGIAYIKQHPWFGVGLGNYLTGDGEDGTLTNQPHEVLILEAGEGGVPEMVLFLVMIAGTSWVVMRRAKRSPWAGVALAVQAAVITHGLVDVYWVRGTPLIGWLLVGMALNRTLDTTTGTSPETEAETDQTPWGPHAPGTLALTST